MSKETLASAAALLLICLWSGASAKAGDGLEKQLPSLDGLVRYGCTVQGPINMFDHSSPERKWQRVWTVTFWAEHKSAYKAKPVKDWKLLYAYRRKRITGLTDCDRFMDRVSEAAQQPASDQPAQLAARKNPRDGT